jgi:hypothetical protein
MANAENAPNGTKWWLYGIERFLKPIFLLKPVSDDSALGAESITGALAVLMTKKPRVSELAGGVCCSYWAEGSPRRVYGFCKRAFELRPDVDTLGEALPVDGKLDNGNRGRRYAIRGARSSRVDIILFIGKLSRSILCRLFKNGSTFTESAFCAQVSESPLPLRLIRAAEPG